MARQFVSIHAPVRAKLGEEAQAWGRAFGRSVYRGQARVHLGLAGGGGEGGVDGVGGQGAQVVGFQGQGLGDGGHVLKHIAAEIRRIVGIDRGLQPALEHGLERMGAEIIDDAELEVAQGANRQGHALGDQTLDQRLVLQRPVAVVQAVDGQQVQGLAHVIGRAFLAGMGDQPQALGPRPGEDPGEFGRRMADFRAIKADADELIAVGQGFFKGGEGLLLAQMA